MEYLEIYFIENAENERKNDPIFNERFLEISNMKIQSDFYQN